MKSSYGHGESFLRMPSLDPREILQPSWDPSPPRRIEEPQLREIRSLTRLTRHRSRVPQARTQRPSADVPLHRQRCKGEDHEAGRE